jgi:alanyl-tRNA synthetase
MKSFLVRQKYIDFFVHRGHVAIPSAPLVPENDPTTLFNSSGMQPLIPYLLGEPHPSGKRLVNSQKAIRTQDIEEVGDNRHTTFFEMLGNWSLGDYFKKEQLSWVFAFLTQEIGLDPKRLYVTVFEGGSGILKDDISIDVWKELFASVGIEARENARIFAYPARKNWWSRSGEPDHMPVGEPGGPDSEIFFDFGEHRRFHENSQWKDEACHPNCDCGRFMEIGNSVFMQYQKQEDGSLKELLQKNVDFGGGLERIVAASLDNPDVFQTDFFEDAISLLEKISGKKYGIDEKTTREMRIVADHLRASTMLIVDGVVATNKTQGYVLRRLVRRSVLKMKQLSIANLKETAKEIMKGFTQVYKDAYPDFDSTLASFISYESTLTQEIEKFERAIHKGTQMLIKEETLTGKVAFDLYQNYGFPWELSLEMATEMGMVINHHEYDKELSLHKEKSRTAASGMFKGGLADQSVETTRLHTAHHLLLAALQCVVDPNIKQKGSNITGERLRIDVNLDRKLTPQEIEKVEALVNQKIAESLPVVRVDMNKEEAEKIGAQMEFGKKYPDLVSVYFVGSTADHFSAEFCGGPHVTNTKEIGENGKKFKLVKDENIGSGLRRFKAVLE